VADLRTRFIEDYAGGLLNIARQELSSTGEVLAQDGFVEGVSLFVEDGRGVKSGLRLGSSLAECIDPTTETGILNVRSADRTYAKIRDLKIFSTAVASAQGALSESVAESFTNLEGAFESLESDVELFRNRLDNLVDIEVTLPDGDRGDITVSDGGGSWSINDGVIKGDKLTDTGVVEGTYSNAEITVDGKGRITRASKGPDLSLPLRSTASGTTSEINDGGSNNISINVAREYLLFKVKTSHAARVILYTDIEARTADSSRAEGTEIAENSGVIAEIITSGEETKRISPGIVGWNNDAVPSPNVYAKVVNKSGSAQEITVTLDYIRIGAKIDSL